MAKTGLKWLEIAEVDGHGLKWLETYENNYDDAGDQMGWPLYSFDCILSS